MNLKNAWMNEIILKEIGMQLCYKLDRVKVKSQENRTKRREPLKWIKGAYALDTQDEKNISTDGDHVIEANSD